MEIISRFLDKVSGYVKLYTIDASGHEHVLEQKRSIIQEPLAEILSKMVKRWKLLKLDVPDKKDFHSNTATSMSKMVHARLLAGNPEFKASRIEWGWDARVASLEDTDLYGHFAPRVYTPIESKEFPKDNILKITTSLLSSSSRSSASSSKCCFFSLL